MSPPTRRTGPEARSTISSLPGSPIPPNRTPRAEANTTVDYWVDRIRPTLGRAAAAIVLAGADLIEAKAAVGHGGFGQLLDELDIKPLAGFAA